MFLFCGEVVPHTWHIPLILFGRKSKDDVVIIHRFFNDMTSQFIKDYLLKYI